MHDLSETGNNFILFELIHPFSFSRIYWTLLCARHIHLSIHEVYTGYFKHIICIMLAKRMWLFNIYKHSPITLHKSKWLKNYSYFFLLQETDHTGERYPWIKIWVNIKGNLSIHKRNCFHFKFSIHVFYY